MKIAVRSPAFRAVCNCVYGDVARVVYSRTFPSLTTPQTGRLNKSPHTVYGITNCSRSACDCVDGKAPPGTAPEAGERRHLKTDLSQADNPDSDQRQ